MPDPLGHRRQPDVKQDLGYEERVAGGGLQEGEPEAAKLHHILEEGHHHLSAEVVHDVKVCAQQPVHEVGVRGALSGLRVLGAGRHAPLEHPRGGQVGHVRVDPRERLLVQRLRLERLHNCAADPVEVSRESAEAAEAERGLDSGGVAGVQDAVEGRRKGRLPKSGEEGKERALRLETGSLRRVGLDALVGFEHGPVVFEALREARPPRARVQVREEVGRSQVLRSTARKRLPKILLRAPRVGADIVLVRHVFIRVNKIAKVVCQGLGPQVRCLGAARPEA
mmetsp:Transcript_10544/g.24535  ORF Transcript_10544/g.24535 Transcript_10544/m.24535 type:complete len:281 (+) Transcript_10544:455-1297(+)